MKRLGLTLTVLLVAAAAAGDDSACGVCHPDSRVAYSKSVHAAERIACVDCHGGDPTATEVEPAHRGAFRPLTDRRQTPERCAECHADLERMRPYNLPVDQLALYRTSQHGQAIVAGRLGAAVCTDCHGAHEIRRPEDPTAPTHPRNLPATCGGCHADAERMAPAGISHTVIDEYLSGRHGLARIEGGNQAAPSCSSCHGVHGATPPGLGDLDKTCGVCHQETRAAFLAGPHPEAMRAAGLPECASCHGAHGVARREFAELGEVCADCHDPDGEEVAIGVEMRRLVFDAAAEVDRAEALVEEAEAGPIVVEDYLSRIEEARTHLTEVGPLIHSVRLEPVAAVVRRARSIGEEVRVELAAELDPTSSYVLLAVVWFYLLVTVAVLLAYKRRLRREGQVR